MSQQPNRSARTLPRIQRREHVAHDEGDGHGWAVSYADLLMVLLAFFVIFFSFDSPSDKNHGLSQLAMGLKAAGFGGPTDSGTQAAASARPEVNLLGRHLSSISPDKVHVDGENIQLLLPDNAFAKGEYQLDSEIKGQLDRIYETLRPFERDLQVVVIGHSDSVQFAQRRSEYLGNNFDLSSLRALRALQYILDKGFPHDHISAQGAADGVRNSRTLSLKVSWKEARP